jgi:hypothetical protein
VLELGRNTVGVAGPFSDHVVPTNSQTRTGNGGTMVALRRCPHDVGAVTL